MQCLMIRLILPILVFVLFCNQVFSQTVTPPVLTEVSVIQKTGDVKISWNFSESKEITIFVDDPNDPGVNYPSYDTVATVHNDTAKSFIHYSANADQVARIYFLKAKIVTQSGTVTHSDPSEHFPTTHLISSFDTCNNSIQLNWNHQYTLNELYAGESDVHFTYEVYRNKNSEGEMKIYGPVSDYLFIDTDIEDNTTYEYHIKAIPDHYPSVKSTSNYVSIETDLKQSPDYINPLSASANGNNTELVFEIAPNSEIDTYKLLKSDSPTGDFDTLETIVSDDFLINATDENSKPDEEISYYKLISVNECNLVTTQSKVINNIVLNVENTNSKNILNWNLFRNHDMVSVSYEIYRKLDNDDALPIRTLQNANSFTDNEVENFQNEYLTNQFCYYVQAKLTNDLNNNYSQSNTKCIFLEPKIYIPEGFTPNGDGRNDLFIPKFKFTQARFEMKIYNRWGNMIYKTNEYKGWDGTEFNGKKAPTGTYIYYIRITLSDNQTIEKRGNVTVIYP